MDFEKRNGMESRAYVEIVPKYIVEVTGKNYRKTLKWWNMVKKPSMRVYSNMCEALG
jgi:hypothetical protein